MWPIVAVGGLLLTSFLSFSGCNSKKVSEEKESRSNQQTVVVASPPPSLPPSPTPASPTIPVCRYRDSLAEGRLYDYYLWQNGRLCQGKEEQGSCSPDPPKVLHTRKEIIAYEGGAIRPKLKRLPYEEKELEAFLIQADQNNQITWVGQTNQEIYDFLQEEIDSTPAKQDIHFVFGFAHYIDGQIEFFNELITNGNDNHKVNGISHLALEVDRYDTGGMDDQPLLDMYLVNGEVDFRPVLENRNWFGSSSLPMKSEAEMEALDKAFELAYTECYNAVLSNGNPPAGAPLSEYYVWAAREIFAVKTLIMRQNPKGRDVVFWRWGACHAEKYHLPFYLGIGEPHAKVISVVVNGGTYIDAFAFDRTLKAMGWLEKTFILKLKGYRDADYIIHIPTQGRKMMWGISDEGGKAVVQQLVDPPKE